MDAPGSSKPIKSTLIDITNCIGCHACQVACKQWNDREGEQTELLPELGFQNPAVLSAKTYTLISFHEFADDKAPGGLRNSFVMRRCLHCLQPACVSACPTTALFRQEDGPVVYDSDKCIGCRYCMLACPWDVPTAEWNSLKPEIQKCTHCADRVSQPLPKSRNGFPLTVLESQTFKEKTPVPACVKACPADALVYGDREEMLSEARRRMANRPGRYVDRIYGEKEAGGTSVLYLSSVPFATLGFPEVGNRSFPGFSKVALGLVPPAVMTLGATLAMGYAYFRKRVAAVAGAVHGADHHPEFERLPNKLFTPVTWLLLLLMAVCGVAMVARFVRGLGGSTHLSDTFPWGLWIVFDLVWIAVAAGAFAMAGIIYIFQRKDLYALGRTAVLMGLLSYSFVTVTLIADLGLPWHFYQLGLQAPEHSAMFEVSWCVGLYVTILLFEFIPVPLEYFGLTRAMAAWRRWSGAYVALAMTLFVYMLSRNPLFAAITLVIFGVVAWRFRSSTEPILLAIAAVTLSTMHQSSLGSLYLLMPNSLAPQWWSPVLPVDFFLSSIVAGTALVVLIAMWIDRAWKRPFAPEQLASVGQITFWALVVYLAFRLGDLAFRGQLATAFSERMGLAFALEILLGGLVPLLLLSRASLRARPGMLFLGSLLAVLGVVYNRINVVIFAMDLRGRMPWVAPERYAPSFVEWGISIGLIAATIFLFGLGARWVPVLPKREAGEVH
ncbi:MAG TPA: 4Fe-4S dicluster domain-containing protein [Myxococcaceae bacterium]|nr:4Fe-4S dicluster domain-containing protein [Myxococcaceae bacterium]